MSMRGGISLQENIDRICGFAELQDGWMNGEGVAITQAAVTRALAMVQAYSSSAYVYPTLRGGIQWEGDTWEHEIYEDGTDEFVEFGPLDDDGEEDFSLDPEAEAIARGEAY